MQASGSSLTDSLLNLLLASASSETPTIPPVITDDISLKYSVFPLSSYEASITQKTTRPRLHLQTVAVALLMP